MAIEDWYHDRRCGRSCGDGWRLADFRLVLRVLSLGIGHCEVSSCASTGEGWYDHIQPRIRFEAKLSLKTTSSLHAPNPLNESERRTEKLAYSTAGLTRPHVLFCLDIYHQHIQQAGQNKTSSQSISATYHLRRRKKTYAYRFCHGVSI